MLLNKNVYYISLYGLFLANSMINEWFYCNQTHIIKPPNPHRKCKMSQAHLLSELEGKFILGQTLGGVNAELDFAKETASTLPLRANYSQEAKKANTARD